MKEERINTDKYEEIKEGLEDIEFQEKEQKAIDYIIEEIRRIDRELNKKFNREIVDVVTYRIKSPESVIKKLKHKGYEVNWDNAQHRLNDLAGVRVICSFQDDVYRLAGKLQKDKNLILIKTKDYIKKPKASGYQSIHVIVDVPMEIKEEQMKEETVSQECEMIRVEIQIRTVAMNFWAKLDHQLCYKKDTKGADKIGKALKSYAEEITKIDKKMLKLRKKIERM